MIDKLVQLDQELFFAINHGLSNHFFDWLMPLLRNKFFWTPLYLFLIVFLIRNHQRKGYIVILFLLITFATTDIVSASFIKPVAARLRPCNDPAIKAQVRSLIACGSGYSFPSSHAANHFGIAGFLITLFYRRWKWIIPFAVAWAAAICFAQVYTGVHYPLDVLCGGILGMLVGYITGTIFLTIQPERRWNPGN